MRRLWWTGVGVLAAAAAASAQSCDCRSGYCGQTACYAQPSDAGLHVGYYVGGGSAFHGDGPLPCEGVWGWDYLGCRFPARVMLLWNHGLRYQGGPGAYRTDGPQPLKDLREKCGD